MGSENLLIMGGQKGGEPCGIITERNPGNDAEAVRQ